VAALPPAQYDHDADKSDSAPWGLGLPSQRDHAAEYRAAMSSFSDELPLEANVSEERSDERRVAYGYVEDAFAEAQSDGLDSDALAHAALFAAFRTLVGTYGEEATAVFSEALPGKIRGGAFSIGTRH